MYSTSKLSVELHLPVGLDLLGIEDRVLVAPTASVQHMLLGALAHGTNLALGGKTGRD